MKYRTRYGVHLYSSSSSADFTNSEPYLYTESLLSHIYTKKNKLSDYWIQQLERVRRPAALRLLKQVVTDNELGFEPANEVRAGTLLEYVLKQKQKYHDKVLLVRVG